MSTEPALFKGMLVLEYNFDNGPAAPEVIADYIQEHLVLDDAAMPNAMTVLAGDFADQVSALVARLTTDDAEVPHGH